MSAASGIHRQGVFEAVHGLVVFLPHQGRASQTDPRPDRVGLQRQRLCEQRLGRLGPALCDVHFPERDQRRHIVGLQREGLVEGTAAALSNAPWVVYRCPR